MRRPVLTLLLISVLTFFLGLGRQAITDSDEGFYAEASREMVETGDWLTPHFNYEDRWQKPVLYYWLTAATYLASGPSEWAARAWSALSGLGLVLLTWTAARRLFGRDDVGWLAGAITATSLGYVAMARLALPDLPLTFCITLTIWAALERRLALAGAAMGLGFLMKGPVAVVVPVIVLIPIWWRERAFTTFRFRDVASAGLLFAVIGLPWYAAMTAQHGVAYLQSFFVGDNLERFATDRFNEPRALWFYAPILVGGMMPWSAFLLLLPARPAFEILRGRRHLDPTEWRLLTWAVVPLVFFTLSIGKQPRYILPVLPPLAILLARAIALRIRPEPGEAVNPRGLAPATWATAVLFVVMAALLYRASPVFTTALPWVTTLSVGALAVTALVLAILAASRQWSSLPRLMTMAAIVLVLAMQFGALSGKRPEPVEDMAELIRAQRMANEPVGQYQVFVRNLGFYTGFPHATLFDEQTAVDFVGSPTRVLLVVRPDDLRLLEAASGVHMERLGQVRYLNTANIRMRTLLSPDPQRELETVLLVANR